MNTVQRQFDKLGLSSHKNVRAPGDNARVSVLLNDFEDADKVLAALVDNAKLWRDSWVQLLATQHATVAEYEKLYDPVVGASDGHGQTLQPTPELQLNRTFRLREAYEDLKNELAQEISQIEARILQPATDARDSTVGVKKTIKKRENKRADYEKSTDKVAKLQRKMGKSAKEDAALAKAQAEMERFQEDFLAADSHLREALPPIIEASFSLVPLLIEGIVLVQNNLLGLYYTYLNRYCEEHEFPSPPPPMDDVIAAWSAAYQPARQEVETITIIARGKGLRATLNLGDEPVRPQPITKSSTFSLRSGLRRTSTQPSMPEPEEEEEAPAKPPRPVRIPSVTSTAGVSMGPSPRRTPSNHNLLPDYSGPHGYVTPTAFTTASGLSPNQSSSHLSPSSTRPGYLSRASSSSTIASATSGTNGFAAAAAAKKKPPPPPPKKKPAIPRAEYVVALYTFQGQSPGDLSFQEGDRIKIVEKTETDQDWWVGELHGRKGNFPANYCRKE